jgi:hypothetical protein
MEGVTTVVERQIPYASYSREQSRRVTFVSYIYQTARDRVKKSMGCRRATMALFTLIARSC